MHLCFIFAKNHSKHRYRTKIEKKTPRENSQMQILHRNQPIEPGATKLASAKLHKRLTEAYNKKMKQRLTRQSI